jgi:hypothetical protein
MDFLIEIWPYHLKGTLKSSCGPPASMAEVELDGRNVDNSYWSGKQTNNKVFHNKLQLIGMDQLLLALRA